MTSTEVNVQIVRVCPPSLIRLLKNDASIMRIHLFVSSAMLPKFVLKTLKVNACYINVMKTTSKLNDPATGSLLVQRSETTPVVGAWPGIRRVDNWTHEGEGTARR